MTIPTIQFNFGYFLDIGNLPLPQMMLRLVFDGGWVPLLIVVVYGSWLLWVQSRQLKFGKTLKFCLLAIDVPKLNEQTPKAVEQIFTHIAGAYSGLDRIEKYWIGKCQAVFSMEIASVDGYVQFLVHCQTKYRDLIEAAVYAQYPDAEIVEVADYTGDVPTQYPNAEWDMWGTEFPLKKPSSLPIRTHLQFEHSASEEYFKDPLSSLLEILSSMRKGERCWLQFLISPTNDDWKDDSKELADKILGKKKVLKKTIVDHLIDIPIGVATDLTIGLLSEAAPEFKKKEDTKMPTMMALSPGERNVLEAVQEKAAKVGFATKIRFVYAGRRGIFSKGKVISSMKGAMGIFSSLDMNQLKPYGKVTPKTDYFWERWYAPGKQGKLVRAYRNRSAVGAPWCIMNVEELATIWHFPFTQVKAPLVQKTDAKRAEPPASLPTAEGSSTGPFKRVVRAPSAPAPTPEPKPEPEAPDEELDALEEELS